jgi:hypothetical protein
VYHGKVGIDSSGKSNEVPGGFAVVAAKTMGNVRPLPPAPDNLLPQQLKVKGTAHLRWDKVTEAAFYHFELSRDILFTDVFIQTDFRGNVVEVDAPAGKYYWRVMTRDGDGIESKPSKLYAIEFEE